ncbi:MAG: ElyC/SanA/YdcF family protein [Clostridiales bacterium]|uniref:SanA/YdcF family protein n=1 Tax=Evtepia sp. TaxID=2773933 RepID=UPI0029848FAB|nr:ElyC/SanA/YdcF family protein [Evtepia sp.]MDD7289430.1 ElyC/SanA/YdcF family protein [Clostridiales bacterium]MDY4431329.1 ElyC/SanA/YdcF family protein [Evtepia sp.]
MSRRKKGRAGRVLLALLLLVLVAAAAVLGGSVYVVWSARAEILSQEEAPPANLDCILVLGCGVHADGTPTPMLRSRMTRAVELYQAGWADKLLLSGDNSRADYNEVATMKTLALEGGVPEEDIVLDHAGFSTYDSLYRARDVFLAERIVIITQEYHLSRALYLADALGLEAWGVAAAPRNDAGQIMRDAREILARDKAILWAILQPEPKFLGDPIPLA